MVVQIISVGQVENFDKLKISEIFSSTSLNIQLFSLHNVKYKT